MDFNTEFDFNEFQKTLNNIKKQTTSNETSSETIKVLEGENKYWEEKYTNLFKQSHNNILKIQEFIDIKEKNNKLKSEKKAFEEKCESLEIEKFNIMAQMERMKTEVEENMKEKLLNLQIDANIKENELQNEITGLKSEITKQKRKFEMDQSKLQNDYKSLLAERNEKLNLAFQANCKLQSEIMSISIAANTSKSVLPGSESEEMKYLQERLVYAESKNIKLEKELNQSILQNKQIILNQNTQNTIDLNTNQKFLNPVVSTVSESQQLNAYALESYDKLPKLVYNTGKRPNAQLNLNRDFSDYKVPKRYSYSYSRKKNAKNRDAQKITVTTVYDAGPSTSLCGSEITQNNVPTSTSDADKVLKQKKRKLLDDSLFNSMLLDQDDDDC